MYAFQIFVDGWTSKSFLVAIIVADIKELKSFLLKQTDQQVVYILYTSLISQLKSAGETLPNDELLNDRNIVTLIIGELRIFGMVK